MNYIFLIDVSHEAIVSGMVSSVCFGILQTLYGAEGEGSGCWPAASKVSIMTFDRVLHFYDISVSLNAIDSAHASWSIDVHLAPSLASRHPSSTRYR